LPLGALLVEVDLHRAHGRCAVGAQPAGVLVLRHLIGSRVSEQIRGDKRHVGSSLEPARVRRVRRALLVADETTDHAFGECVLHDPGEHEPIAPIAPPPLHGHLLDETVVFSGLMSKTYSRNPGHVITSARGHF
jgi:hypothetical protein